MDMQQLSEALALPPSELITELGMLEISGIVRREIGNRFYLPLRARK